MTEHVRQRKLMRSKPLPRIWSVSFKNSGLYPTGERTDLARGMVAEVAVGDAVVRNDFDNISIFQRPIFNATWDSKAGCWKDFVAKGEAGFTYTPTEENREVVYRCTPFWYRIEYAKDGDPNFFSVSDSPQEGYRLAPMFRDGKTFEYRPCFEMSVDAAGKPHSRAGVEPLQGTALSVVSACRNFDKAARTESYTDGLCDFILLMVEFATKDLKSVMKGNANALPLRSALVENGLEKTGLYIEDTEWVKVGQNYILYYYFYDTYVSKTVTVLDIDEEYIDGFGHYLTLDIDEKEVYDIGNEGAAAYLCGFAKPTGEALAVVTNASSGIASTKRDAPCVWRGKENPWGNVGSLIWDMAAALREDHYINPCVLDDFANFDGSINSHYTEYPKVKSYIGLSTYLGKINRLIEEEPYYFVPISSYNNDMFGYGCRIHLDHPYVTSDVARFLRVGGSYRTEKGGHHSIWQFLGQSVEDDCFGGRLVMKEGLQ